MTSVDAFLPRPYGRGMWDDLWIRLHGKSNTGGSSFLGLHQKLWWGVNNETRPEGVISWGGESWKQRNNRKRPASCSTITPQSLQSYKIYIHKKWKERTFHFAKIIRIKFPPKTFVGSKKMEQTVNFNRDLTSKNYKNNIDLIKRICLMFDLWVGLLVKGVIFEACFALQRPSCPSSKCYDLLGPSWIIATGRYKTPQWK